MTGPAEAPSRITPAAWSALALIACTNVMSLLDRNILAILAPRIKADLQIGDAEMGLLYGTVFALFYALFSLPLGRLADGWVRRKLLSIAIGFWSLATLTAGFANGFAMLAVSRLGVGIGEGASQPAGTSLLFDYFPRHRRGLVMAVLAAAIAVGLGGSLVLGGVAADWWDVRYAAGAAAPLGLAGWQFAFVVAALPGFLLMVLLWRMPEPERGVMDGIITPPDPHPFRASAGVLGGVTPGFNLIALLHGKAGIRQIALNLVALVLIVVAMMLAVRWTSAFSPRPPLQFGSFSVSPHALQWTVTGFGIYVLFNWFQQLRLNDRAAFALIALSPSLMIALMVGSLQSAINYGVMGFTPSFLIKTYGLSTSETGLMFGFLSAGIGIVGPMVAGPVSDWTNRLMPASGRIWLTLFSLGLSPLIAQFVYRAPDPTTFIIFFTLYSLVLTMWLPPLYAAFYELVLPRMRGTTSGFYTILSTIIGLGTGPYVVGMVSDANGGNLGTAILTINWVAIPIVILLIVLALRIRRDEAALLTRARAAGEPV